MRRVEDYRGHAQDCRELARRMPPEYRQQLLDMAEEWEKLARERQTVLAAEGGANEH